jgi:hypothetical protein
MNVQPCAYKSIVDCAICAQIPQKMAEDLQTGSRKVIPLQVDSLLTVIEFEDDDTQAYCTSTTRLLKCEVCGTYYYYNHYKDDGQHFMDPTCDEVTVRRYSPQMARQFLEGLAGLGDVSLPNPMGAMKKAFAEGTRAPTPLPERVTLDERTRSARRELAELNGRYSALMDELRQALQQRPLEWQIKTYATEALFHHFLVQDDWEALNSVLLEHADPVVRISVASWVIGIATGDSPVIDLVHTSRNLREMLAARISKEGRWAKLIQVLMDAALNDRGKTLEYDHGYGSSSYSTRSLRSLALYSLVVAADHQPKLMEQNIPALMGLLGEYKSLNYQICWILRTLAEKKHAAPLILAELERLNNPQLMKDEDVINLVKVCQGEK